MTDARYRAWDAIHDALLDGWAVGPTTSASPWTTDDLQVIGESITDRARN